MQFSSRADLAKGLLAWRDHQKVSREKIAENVANLLKKNSFGVTAVRRWEHEKDKDRTYPSFDKLVEVIFPAYGIRDLDHFVFEYCSGPYSHKDVRIVRKENWSSITRHGNVNRRYVDDRKFLGSCPIRIDQITVPAGGESDLMRHTGFNFLLVMKGILEIRFTDSSKSPEKLVDGDAICFPTRLGHTLRASDGEVQFVVARPAWADDL